MASLREQVLRHFSPEAQADDPDARFTSALELLLWSIEAMPLSVDGWSFFRIVRESAEHIETVGLMTLLPEGSVPIRIDIEKRGDGFAWAVRIGCMDSEWQALSDAKRWNRVYLYAAGDRADPEWTWADEHHGARPGGAFV